MDDTTLGIIFLAIPVIGILATIAAGFIWKDINRWIALYAIPFLTVVVYFCVANVANLTLDQMNVGIFFLFLLGAVGVYYFLLSCVFIILHYRARHQRELLHLDEHPNQWKKVLKKIVVFLLVVFLIVGAVYVFDRWNEKAIKDKKAMEMSNYQKSLPDNKTVNPTPVPQSNEQVKIKGQKANVKALMTSIISSAVSCEDAKKQLLSGSGGSKMCEDKNFTWPTIKACGPKDSDTEWVVKNGDGVNWEVAVNCKEFIDCNGTQNAFCNATSGCVFSGSCQ